MYEWWHDFLYDSTTFGATMWLLLVFVVLIGIVILTWRDFK